MPGRLPTSSDASLRRLQSQTSDDGFYPVPEGQQGIAEFSVPRQKRVRLNGGAVIRAMLAKGTTAVGKSPYGIYLFARRAQPAVEEAAFKLSYRFQETPLAVLGDVRPGARFLFTANSTVLASHGIVFGSERLDGLDVITIRTGSSGPFEASKDAYAMLELQEILPATPEWRLAASQQAEMAVLRFRVHSIYPDRSLYSAKKARGPVPIALAPEGSLLDLPAVVMRNDSIVEVPPSLPKTSWSNVELTVQDAMRLLLTEEVEGPQKVRFAARRSWIIFARRILDWDGEQSVEVELRWTGPTLLSVSPHEFQPDWSFTIPTLEPTKRESFGFTPRPTADDFGTLGQVVHLSDRTERDALRRAQEVHHSYTQLPRGGGPLLKARLFTYTETASRSGAKTTAEMQWQLQRAYRGAGRYSVLVRLSALVDSEPSTQAVGLPQASEASEMDASRAADDSTDPVLGFDFLQRALQARAEFDQGGFWPVPDATSGTASKHNTGLSNTIRYTYGTIFERIYEVGGLPPPSRTHGREWRQMWDSVTKVADSAVSRQFRLRLADPRIVVKEAALPPPGGVLYFGGGVGELASDGLLVTSLSFQLDGAPTFKAVHISSSSPLARASKPKLPAQVVLKSVVPAPPIWSPSLAAQVKTATMIFSLNQRWKNTNKTSFVAIPKTVKIEVHLPVLLFEHQSIIQMPTPVPDHRRARMMGAAAQIMKRLLTPSTVTGEEEEGKTYRQVMPWVAHFVKEGHQWRIQVAWETISLVVLTTTETSSWSIPISYTQNNRYLTMIRAGTTGFKVLRLDGGDIGSLGWLNVLIPDADRHADPAAVKKRGTVVASVEKVVRTTELTDYRTERSYKHAEMHWVFEKSHNRSINLRVVVPVLFDPEAAAVTEDDLLPKAEARDDRYKRSVRR